MTDSPDLDHLAKQLRTEGWASMTPLLPADLLDKLTIEITAMVGDERGGTRNLLELPIVRDLANAGPVRGIAESVLGERCFAVRGILFDKTPTANWKVVWHQDLSIAVRERIDVDGFGPWSVKEGVPHVQPPTEILERMLAVRIHLDDCGPENGPVRVIPRTHRAGRLSPTTIDVWRAQHSAIDCVVARGAILAFFPLLLHASSASRRPEHRRVIHLEFAATDLPGGLEWYYSTSQGHPAVSSRDDRCVVPQARSRDRGFDPSHRR